MDGQVVEKFQEHFGKMKDSRVERTKLYPLEEILFVLLCGSICGAESWRDFVMFGQEKLDFLREYFPFSAGIACKNTFARVSAALQPEQFRACFIAWKPYPWRSATPTANATLDTGAWSHAGASSVARLTGWNKKRPGVASQASP